jgi:hypothetical protein
MTNQPISIQLLMKLTNEHTDVEILKLKKAIFEQIVKVGIRK